MKKNKRIVVLNEDSSYDIPSSPDAFLEYWSEIFNRVPGEHRDTIRIDIEAYMDYDSPSIMVEVYYNRTETDDEHKERIEKDSIRADEQRKKDLQQLDILMAKYGKEA